MAAGLMLIWPMDLIIAADNARFSDPVVRMAIGGVVYHGHTWEFGARKAKELLFTAGSIDAEEAPRLGMGISEEHTSELQSLMRISYDIFCLKKKTKPSQTNLI